jgi:hypothetical protein
MLSEKLRIVNHSVGNVHLLNGINMRVFLKPNWFKKESYCLICFIRRIPLKYLVLDDALRISANPYRDEQPGVNYNIADHWSLRNPTTRVSQILHQRI